MYVSVKKRGGVAAIAAAAVLGVFSARHCTAAEQVDPIQVLIPPPAPLGEAPATTKALCTALWGADWDDASCVLKVTPAAANVYQFELSNSQLTPAVVGSSTMTAVTTIGLGSSVVAATGTTPEVKVSGSVVVGAITVGSDTTYVVSAIHVLTVTEFPAGPMRTVSVMSPLTMTSNLLNAQAQCAASAQALLGLPRCRVITEGAAPQCAGMCSDWLTLQQKQADAELEERISECLGALVQGSLACVQQAADAEVCMMVCTQKYQECMRSAAMSHDEQSTAIHEYFKVCLHDQCGYATSSAQ